MCGGRECPGLRKIRCESGSSTATAFCKCKIQEGRINKDRRRHSIGRLIDYTDGPPKHPSQVVLLPAGPGVVGCLNMDKVGSSTPTLSGLDRFSAIALVGYCALADSSSQP